MLNLYKIWDNAQYFFALFFLFVFGISFLVMSKSSEIKTENYAYQVSDIKPGTYNFTGHYSSHKKANFRKYTKIDLTCIEEHLERSSQFEKERFSSVVILKSVVIVRNIETSIVYKGLKGAPEKEDVAVLNDAMFSCLNKKEP